MFKDLFSDYIMRNAMSKLLASKHNLKLCNVDDALDVMGSGLHGCIFTLADLGRDFFNLKTKIAGEVFQKFVNYNFKVAFIIPADHNLGNRVTELIRDHARHNCIRFFETIDEAEKWIN